MTQGANFSVSEEVRLAHIPQHAAAGDELNPRNTAEYVPRRAAAEGDDLVAPSVAAELAGHVAAHAAVGEDDDQQRGARQRVGGTPGEDTFLDRLVTHFDDTDGTADERDDRYTGDGEVDDGVAPDAHLRPYAAAEYEGEPLVEVPVDGALGADVDAVDDTDGRHGESYAVSREEYEQVVSEVRQSVVRPHMTEPQILERGQRVRRNEEPTFGYWSGYVNAVGRWGQNEWSKISGHALEMARERPAEFRTSFDNYVLGTRGDEK